MARQTPHVEGLVSAPFTAMNPDCSINFDVIEKQASFLYNNGVTGAFICGTTGEGMSLATQERKDLAQRWVEVAPEDLKVIVHIGDNCLKNCISLGEHAQEIGAWGIGMMAPFFFKPQSVKDLVDFCAEAAASAPDLPFYYYHMPSMTGVNFPMIAFLKEASGKIPNLAGIKYTYEDLMDYQLCLNFENGRYDMLFGRDELLICSLSLGARGAVGSTYNFAAPLYFRVIEAFTNGDLAEAAKLQKQAVDLIQLLIKSPGSFNAVGKSIMKMLGVDCGPVRSPLTNITQMQYDDLKTELKKINFFDEIAVSGASGTPPRKNKRKILGVAEK